MSPRQYGRHLGVHQQGRPLRRVACRPASPHRLQGALHRRLRQAGRVGWHLHQHQQRHTVYRQGRPLRVGEALQDYRRGRRGQGRGNGRGVRPDKNQGCRLSQVLLRQVDENRGRNLCRRRQEGVCCLCRPRQRQLRKPRTLWHQHRQHGSSHFRLCQVCQHSPARRATKHHGHLHTLCRKQERHLADSYPHSRRRERG